MHCELKIISKSIDNLEAYIKFLENKISKYEKRDERRCDFHAHKITRDIIKHLCNGFDENTAQNLVAEEYSNILTTEHIKMIWNESKRQKNALTHYARVFMVKIMKEAGHSVSEIACTMNLSITTINKLLKSECPL